MRAMTMAMLASLAAVQLAASPAGGEESVAAKVPAAEEEFRIPPGFREKKRGKHVLYCRKETSIGTRFESEKCYDEQGLREMARARQEDQVMIDQTRRICAGQGAVCGGT